VIDDMAGVLTEIVSIFGSGKGRRLIAARRDEKAGSRLRMRKRKFPRPWQIVDPGKDCFKVADATGTVLLTIPNVKTLNPQVILFNLTPAEAWMLASWIIRCTLDQKRSGDRLLIDHNS